jgi:hypothetical protein
MMREPYQSRLFNEMRNTDSWFLQGEGPLHGMNDKNKDSIDSQVFF